MATDHFSLPDNVYSQLRSLSSRIRALSSLRGFGLAVAISVGVILSCIALDWIVDLPKFIRFGLLAAFVFAVIFSIFRLVLVPLMRRFDSNELAVLLESGNPELKESVSSAIELSDESLPSEHRGSSWMRKQLTRWTAKRVANADTSKALSKTSSLRGLGIGLAALIILAIPCMLWPNSSKLMASRFFQPWKNLDRPTNLYFEVLNGDRVIARGSDAKIVAIPRWHENEEPLPESVLLNWSFEDGDTGRKRMTWDEGDEAYVAEIRNVVADFDFYIEAGATRSKDCLLYTSPSPRDATLSRMPSSA